VRSTIFERGITPCWMQPATSYLDYTPAANLIPQSLVARHTALLRDTTCSQPALEQSLVGPDHDVLGPGTAVRTRVLQTPIPTE
jgi:hypothetical protein